MPGKGKKGKKNAAPVEKNEADKAAELVLPRKQQEEERAKKWIEAWDEKLKTDECEEDLKASCCPDTFYAKPRHQSNVWIQTYLEKNLQHVYMTFGSRPIPKPPAPPLPNLKPEKPREPEVKKDENKKKSKKGKKKKKQ